MSRSRRGKKAGEDAERLLQEAFGVSEDQLLKDFILAQTEVKDSDIPPEPEDGFERLMAKLEAEVGTSPESEKESSSENIVKLHEEARKPRRLKTIVKVSVAAAAIAVMVVAMGISGRWLPCLFHESASCIRRTQRRSLKRLLPSPGSFSHRSEGQRQSKLPRPV